MDSGRVVAMTEDYPLSASQVKTYKRCPESYRLKYVSDVKPTKASRGYRSAGSAVHDTIENVLTRSPQLRDEEHLNKRFEQELSQLEYEYSEDMRENVITCLSNAARYISTRNDTIITGVETDHTFHVTRPDISYPYRGIMDVITKTEIWDWKTGKKRPEDERIQAAVYMAAYTNYTGHAPEAIRFIYLKNREVSTYQQGEGDDGFWSEDGEPDGWDEVITLSKQILRAREKGDFVARPSDSKCYWCDYEMSCGASKVGVGSESPEKFVRR